MKKNEQQVTIHKIFPSFLALCNVLLIREAYFSPKLYPWLLFSLPLFFVAFWKVQQQKKGKVHEQVWSARLLSILRILMKGRKRTASDSSKLALTLKRNWWTIPLVPVSKSKKETMERSRWN